MTADTTGRAQDRLAARARLDEMARFPDRDDPDAARRLAAAFGVLAEERRAEMNRWMGAEGAEPPPWSHLVFSLEAIITALLTVLDQADSGRARDEARVILDAWDAEEAMGALLTGYLAALGVDPREIGRLEAAWNAA